MPCLLHQHCKEQGGHSLPCSFSSKAIKMAPPNVALVTGATGITGRHLVDALLRRRNRAQDRDGQAWRVVTLARRELEGLSAEDAKDVTQAGGQGQGRRR